MNERMVRCEQRRHDCIMCNQRGNCTALNNTTFKKNGKTYPCPFYKSRKDHIANVVEDDENGEEENDTELGV